MPQGLLRAEAVGGRAAQVTVARKRRLHGAGDGWWGVRGWWPVAGVGLPGDTIPDEQSHFGRYGGS